VSDETVVETDGVTVSKFFNAEDFPVPAVAFEVSSSREDAVEFTIVDEIPDEFGIDQIGFHPEYGSEHWTATGDGVVRFEREIEAGEEFTTVYGVRMEDGQDETPFLSAPTIEIDGEDIDEVVPPESTDVVRELAGGERDTVPGLEDDEESVEAEVDDGIEAEVDETAAVPDDDAEILEGDVALGTDSEPGVSGGADPESVAEDDDPADDTDASAPADPGLSAELDDDAESIEESTEPVVDDDPVAVDGSESVAPTFDAGDVAGALATAIREDAVDDDDLETIQEAFGGVPNSTQAEIEHVQSRVSELEAYTDALEAFIDENGPAQDLLADIEDDVAELENDIAEVEASVENAADERETIRGRVEDVEESLGAIDDLEGDLERLRGDLDALDERVADTEDAVMDVEAVEDDVDQLESDLDDVEAHVEEIEAWRDQLSDVFGT